MNTESLDISIGTRLWYQGAAWTVVEHGGDGVLLRSGESFKKVHGASLVGIAEPLGDEVQAETRELDTVVLGTLDRNQRAEIERQAKIFDDVFSTGSHVPADNLYQAAANKLGVSLRTAYRRGQRYANQGIVGLVDARRLKSHHRAIDPE